MVYQCPMVQPFTRRVATSAGILALVITGLVTTTAAADDAGSGEVTDATWYALADDAADELEATDWEALSAADGCELVAVEITEVVDPVANAEAGAPEDLAVTVVEREEVCGGSLTPALAFHGRGESIDGAPRAAVAPGSDCSGTSGPGTICISRSGSYVSTSFQYGGSGTISAFLKLYRISSSASGCPTGDTIATSSTSSYSNGTRRSLTVYAPSYAGYSAHIWKYVGLGVNTNWGSACGVL